MFLLHFPSPNFIYVDWQLVVSLTQEGLIREAKKPNAAVSSKL